MKKKARPPLPVLPQSVQDINTVFLKGVATYYDYNQPAPQNTCYARPEPPITAQQLAQVPHLDWVPAAMLEFYRLRNGFTLQWEIDWRNASGLVGRIILNPLQKVVRDWEGEVYFRKQLTPENACLQDFKVVDACADESVVGWFYTAACDPELYFYDLEEPPQKLGVDLSGYVALLTHTLGCSGWQNLLHELEAPTPENRPYQPNYPAPQRAAALLQATVPGFDLQAFVACYDRVRLPASGLG